MLNMSKWRYYPNFNSPSKPKPLVVEAQSDPAFQQPMQLPKSRNNIRLRKGVPTKLPTGDVSFGGSNNFQKKSRLDVDTLNQFEPNKVKQNQKRIQDMTTTNSKTTASSSSTPTTSSYTTTSKPVTDSGITSKTTTTNMAKRNNNGGNTSSNYKAPDDVRVQALTTPPVHTEFTNKDNNADSIFIALPSSSPVDFRLDIPSVVHLNQFEVTDMSTPDLNPRLLLNMSSFGAAYRDMDYNDIIKLHTETAFNRINRDVLSNARSQTYSSWSLTNFKEYNASVLEALETIIAFRSIQTYDPKQDNPYNINRALHAYQVKFQDVSLQNAIYNLEKAIKGFWFPPNFSQLIRWFYQNYRVSPLSQAAYYRYLPHGTFLVGSASGYTVADLRSRMETVLAQLNTTTNQTIASMLTRIYPQGIIRSIPFSYNDAIFDRRHFEIYTNEPIVHGTVGASGAVCYPISYGVANNPGSTNNEIPYYQSSDPSTMDGLAFCLQTLIGTSASSGNVLPSTLADLRYVGIREPLSVGNGANPSTAQLVITGNKYIYHHNENAYYVRAGNIQNGFVGNDANTAYAFRNNEGSSPAAYTTSFVSRPNTSHQRVYFNNFRSPALNMTMLLDRLWSLS